jgi:hypothetical protein
MSTLPPRADVDQLRRRAKERLAAARAGDAAALATFSAANLQPTLASAQLLLAREHGLPSWPALLLAIAHRRVLDLRDPAALATFVREHPETATAELSPWRDHPHGASPLGCSAAGCAALREPRDVADSALLENTNAIEPCEPGA